MSKPFDLKPGYTDFLIQQAEFSEAVARRRDAAGDKVSAILFRSDAARLREEALDFEAKSK